MSLSLDLPGADGAPRSATRCATRADRRPPRRPRRSTASPTRPRMSSPTRCAAIDPWLQCAVDWDATIAYRRHLWSLGLGVAEAMDTAQRGMGLDWPTSLELIRRALGRGARRARRAGRFGLRHRPSRPRPRCARVDDVIRAYEEQMEAIEALGGRLIVMASRALARVAQRPGRLRARLRPRAAPGAGSRSSCTGSATCSTRRSPATGAARDLDARDGDRARRDRRECREGRRHQDLAARQGQGDRDAPAPAGRRAHVHRRRLQLRRS